MRRLPHSKKDVCTHKKKRGIKSVDEQVAKTTETRKEEHEKDVETLANDTAAKELIKFAKNMLQKFYNPKLYKEAPKREPSEKNASRSTMAAPVPRRQRQAVSLAQASRLCKRRWHHRRLRDVRVRDEYALHLEGGDVLPAGDDDVLRAVLQLDVPRLPSFFFFRFLFFPKERKHLGQSKLTGARDVYGGV